MPPTKPPTRDALAVAIGRVLFLRLSKENTQALFKDAGVKPDWAVVTSFTRQCLRSTAAAATVGSHLVAELAVLDAALEPQMFLGGATPCVADLACYIATISAMQAFGDAHKWALCNVSRWFAHMQYTVVPALSPPAALGCDRRVAFDTAMPSPPPTVASLPLLVGPPGGAAGSSAEPAEAAAPTGGAAGGAGAPEGAKQEKKEKKEKKEKPAKAAPVAVGSDQSDISKLDIRVGLIISAEPHPEAEKLFVEKVDVGEPTPRTVVSGLVDFMPASALTNRRAVLVCNLKPAKMRGIESCAMVLCASDDAHTMVELLVPPEGAAIGERVTFEGCPGEPLLPNQVSKKKVWEAVQPELSTNADGVACYKNLVFTTTSGPCTVATLKNSKIK